MHLGALAGPEQETMLLQSDEVEKSVFSEMGNFQTSNGESPPQLDR